MALVVQKFTVFRERSFCVACGRQLRLGSSWKKRVLKREVVKQTVIQYAGRRTEPTERVYVWGYAGTGALGMRTYMRPERGQNPLQKQMFPARMTFWDKNNMKVKSAACGYGYTMFVVQAGGRYNLYGTGINTESQIGRYEYPRKSGRILDFIIEPVQVDLPLERSDTKILQVACGRSHSVVLTQEGVFSLGSNAHGQCGRPVIDNEDYRANPLVYKIKSLPDDISQVICGQDHTVFLTQSGHVYSCGLGSDGQTGLGHYKVETHPQRVRGDLSEENIVQVAGTADCMLAVSEKGDVFGWGNSEYNQLGAATHEAQVASPTLLPVKCGRVKHVAAAGSMCALVSESGDVRVWGYGILGKGPKADESSVPSLIPATLFGRSELNRESVVTNVYAGLNHFTALTEDGEIYMWGHNANATLGLGHVNQQYFPVKVSVPAAVKSVACGVDHMVVTAKSFC